MDIGSEEGYSVFNALIKGANFAKGLNIDEAKEYDFFPEHSRPEEITTRKRDDILNTQEFLIKEYSLQNKKNVLTGGKWTTKIYHHTQQHCTTSVTSTTTFFYIITYCRDYIYI